ncbi:hypothetical protein ON010_g11393 [Phytophthora cinnamomi]|nr:hypothetical protein ON010_g11393 [Phytophthora cinnamomi]
MSAVQISERIRSIMPTLSDFRSVMTDLQKVGQHIGDVHGIFQGMTEDYPELKDYIAADGNISHSSQFESAVVKILDSKKDSLTLEEGALVKRFVRYRRRLGPLPDATMPKSSASENGSVWSNRKSMLICDSLQGHLLQLNAYSAARNMFFDSPGSA